MAWVCSSSRRSPSGSSCALKSSMPLHSSRQSVPPAIRKNNRFITMRSSYADIRDLPDHQNADDLGNNGIREKLGAGGIGPEQAHVLGLENPEADSDYQRQGAEQARRKALLRGVGLHLGGHIQTLADQGGEILQDGHHV